MYRRMERPREYPNLRVWPGCAMQLAGIFRLGKKISTAMEDKEGPGRDFSDCANGRDIPGIAWKPALSPPSGPAGNGLSRRSEEEPEPLVNRPVQGCV